MAASLHSKASTGAAAASGRRAWGSSSLRSSSLLLGRRSGCRSSGGGSRSSTVAVRASTLISISAKGSKDLAVPPAGDLSAYIHESPKYFGALELPLGGRLDAIDLDKGLFELTVPRIQLFDLWLQPRAVAVIKVVDDGTPGCTRLIVTARQCRLLGSHHVEQYKLNERFVLNVDIQFASEQRRGPRTPGRLDARGAISVKVDIPPPFNLMPSPVLQATGDAALAATMTILLNAFMTAIGKDYVRWSQQQQKAQHAHQAQHPTHQHQQAHHPTHQHQQQPHAPAPAPAASPAHHAHSHTSSARQMQASSPQRSAA